MADLGEIRKNIDSIDNQLLELMNKRARLALQVKATTQGKTPIRPERETDIIRRLSEHNPGPLPTSAIRSIFTQMIASFRDQMQLDRANRVGYLGPRGTYSEEAVTKLFGQTVDFQPEDSISMAVRAVERGATDLAVIPIENSSEGSVTETHQLLLETKVKIVSEITLPIVHCLLSNELQLDTITVVYGHPQALGQSREWLAKYLPRAKQTPSTSNAAAAKQAATQKHSAAIAGKQAGIIYNLNSIKTGINDQLDNETRFVALGNLVTKPTGHDKTSVVCIMQDKPGALYETLKPLAQQGISMTRLTSQPYKQGQYVFYIDFEGHQEDDRVKAMFKHIHQHTVMWKVIGSYAKGLAP